VTNRQRKYIKRLQTRADTLKLRLAAATCTKLDDEQQELNALEWAISTLTGVCNVGSNTRAT